MRKSFWLNFFLVLVGIVIGELTANVTSGISALSWLSYGLDFGTAAPVTLDLHVITLTFGISVTITVSTIIFVILSLVIGRALVRR